MTSENPTTLPISLASVFEQVASMFNKPNFFITPQDDGRVILQANIVDSVNKSLPFISLARNPNGTICVNEGTRGAYSEFTAEEAVQTLKRFHKTHSPSPKV
jgi:hypothetical protein